MAISCDFTSLFDKMAGNADASINLSKIICVLLSFLSMTASLGQVQAASGIQCLSQSGKPVDWYIIYKLPQHTSNVDDVDMFYYMDVDQPHWTLSPATLLDKGQAVYHTLAQVYENKTAPGFLFSRYASPSWLYLMYNDEPATGKRHPRSSSHGHTKGVIAFDDQTGFWLVHSTPKFPPPRHEGYAFPDSATRYGQSFLCISLATDTNLDEIGRQLLYNYPGIYDKGVYPANFVTKYPNMAAAMSNHHVQQPPWFRETQLVSLAGTQFTSFAKYSKFNADMYSTLLAPRFQEDLLVETWQNGINKLCSNCTGHYKVFNIESLEFRDQQTKFTETQDHSKWAVTNTTGHIWTCIGDINRQESQETRPGGTVCFQNRDVWQNFHLLMVTYHDCGEYKKCVNVNSRQ